MKYLFVEKENCSSSIFDLCSPIEAGRYYLLRLRDNKIPTELDGYIRFDKDSASTIMGNIANNVPVIVKNVESTITAAFADKKVGGKSLFTRIHGVVSPVQVGENTIDFSIPYAQCKINGMEFIGCADLETANFEIYMGETKLNQFGFGVVLTNELYKYVSQYDADLFQGLTLRVVYTALSIKNIGINYMLHEVK